MPGSIQIRSNVRGHPSPTVRGRGPDRRRRVSPAADTAADGRTRARSAARTGARTGTGQTGGVPGATFLEPTRNKPSTTFVPDWLTRSHIGPTGVFCFVAPVDRRIAVVLLALLLSG